MRVRYVFEIAVAAGSDEVKGDRCLISGGDWLLAVVEQHTHWIQATPYCHN